MKREEIKRNDAICNQDILPTLSGASRGDETGDGINVFSAVGSVCRTGTAE